MSITLEEAERALDAAIAKANELGAKMNIAVVDAGGKLVAFKRMNGAIWAGVYGSLLGVGFFVIDYFSISCGHTENALAKSETSHLRLNEINHL